MKPPTIRYADGPEGRIAYQVLGDGPIDLVCQAGPVLNLEIAWDYPAIERYLLRLASFSRLVLTNFRGVGLGDPVRHGTTLEEWTTDLECLFDAVGLQRASMLASDNAGPFAILCAATYPDRVQSLALIDTYATLQQHDDYPWGMPHAMLAQLAEFFVANWGTSGVLRHATPELADDKDLVEMLARMERLGFSQASIRNWTAVMTAIDVRGVLSSIRADTLVITHAEHALVRAGHGRYLAEHIPGARLLERPGPWSLPWVHDVEGTLGEVETFFTGTRSAPDLDDRSLATLLFTDIVDSTRRAAEMGDHAWRALLDDHDRLTRREIQRFRGRMVKSTGDGVLATFDGPARAIRCAVALDEVLVPLNLEVRCGLHTGEIEGRGEDVGGIAVHIAERVMARAGPGELLVSGAVPPLVAGSGIGFEDRGEAQLKGVPGSWRLFAVTGLR